jgi:hypothetical protein
MFYVPLFSVDDSPPIVGTFPKDRDDAADYFRNAEQLGAWQPSREGQQLNGLAKSYS